MNSICKRWFLIRANSRFRTIWDIVIILLSLWNCFTLPVDIAFQPASFDSAQIVIFNNFIDVLFAIDIIINFRTSIINDIQSEEITDAKRIAINYIKTRFFLDILASIPFDSLISIGETSRRGGISDNFALLSMLKIFRILRFTRIISYLNATENVKLSLKLFKLSFYLIIYLHW